MVSCKKLANILPLPNCLTNKVVMATTVVRINDRTFRFMFTHTLSIQFLLLITKKGINATTDNYFVLLNEEEV